MSEFRMPSLGADMESGTLVEWLVRPGQAVKRGQVVAVVETQKGAVEVEIWEDGIVQALLVQPGACVPVGEVLATLADDTPLPAPMPPPLPSGEGVEVLPARSIPASESIPSQPIPDSSRQPTVRLRASPAARRRAQELGVDLAGIHGTGPNGAVSLEDVEHAARAAQTRATRPAAGAYDPAAMRAAIAAAMAKSKREIPHYYLGTSIDVGHAQDWLSETNAQRPVKARILFAAVLLAAVARGLREVPELNGFWIDGSFQSAESVHLGVGIALRGGGLVAPAIQHADRMSVSELMQALGDLVQRARAGALRSSELNTATVTVTNLGEQGVESVYGVIYPPQVALVGLGKILERPWVQDGAVCVRPVVNATLAADHRASVGHRGALFLAALDRLLQEPEKLA